MRLPLMLYHFAHRSLIDDIHGEKSGCSSTRSTSLFASATGRAPLAAIPPSYLTSTARKVGVLARVPPLFFTCDGARPADCDLGPPSGTVQRCCVGFFKRYMKLPCGNVNYPLKNSKRQLCGAQAWGRPLKSPGGSVSIVRRSADEPEGGGITRSGKCEKLSCLKTPAGKECFPARRAFMNAL